MSQAPNQGRRAQRDNGSTEYNYKLGSSQQNVPGTVGTTEMYSCQRNNGWLGLTAPPVPTGPASISDDHLNKQERFSAIHHEPFDSWSAHHCYPIDVKASYILTPTRPFPSSSFAPMSGTPGSSSRPSQYYQQEPTGQLTGFEAIDDHALAHHLTASIQQQQQQHQEPFTADDYNQWNGPEPTLPTHGSSYDEQEFARPYQHAAHQSLPPAYYHHGPSYDMALANYVPAASYGPVTSMSYPPPVEAAAAPPAAALPAPPMGPPAPPANQKKKPQPHLKFVRYQEANPLYCGNDRVYPKIWADCDSTLSKIDSQPRLVCYRRNYVVVDVMFRLPLPRTPGWEDRYWQGFRGKMLHVVDSRGKHRQVGGFAVGISALIDGPDGKDVGLVQHTAKRRADDTTRVGEVELLPNLGRSATYQHNVQVLPADNTGIDQMPLLPNQIRYENQRIPSHNTHTFERMQFGNATANNGQRRAAQQFFHLVVTLHADIAPLNSDGADGTHEPRWMPVRHLFSHGLIVRGRSPTHYHHSDHAGRILVNEEDLDPAVNDYNTPDDGSVAPVPFIPVAPGALPPPPPRPYNLQIAPLSTDPIGGWNGLLEDDGHDGLRRIVASAGTGAPSVARAGAGRQAGTGPASRGRGASAPRPRGGRTARTPQSALAQQNSGKVEKKTSRKKKPSSTSTQQRCTRTQASAIAPPKPRGNNRQESAATTTTTSTTTTTTTGQLNPYPIPGQYFQPINNMIRDTEPTPVYTFGDFVGDSGYDLEHGQLHDRLHDNVHENVHEHQHGHDYELGYEQDIAQAEGQDQGHELDSPASASSSVKHEQSSSLSPQLRRHPSAYHPASFLTPESELSQLHRQIEYDPSNISPPIPPFRGMGDPTMQYSQQTVFPGLLSFTDGDFCFVDDVHTAVDSAERSTDQ